ncbi:MAG: alpha-L-rhamnosidase N-terminal domain-containing protein [Clostridia bacterium]|nr:alpha-L-rhamnosidase N-terminal domain-containing protein [Clostridia bacterium]
MKDCNWITKNGAGAHDMQIYYFKKSFDLKVVKAATIEISAQARYKLYINGQRIGVGPCKGSREKTFFDTYDITNVLTVGENEIFVEVLQLYSTDVEGKPTPIEGVLRKGALMLACELKCGDVTIVADESWQCAKNEGIVQEPKCWSCYSASTREVVDSKKAKALEYESAVKLCGVSNGEADHFWWGGTNMAFLYKRPIPNLSLKDKTEIIKFDGEYFEADYLTFGFPRFKISGKGTVKLYYFECFGSDDGKTNNDRCDRSYGIYKEMVDTVTVDNDEYIFEPFWFRCFRFIKVEKTGDVSVIMDSFTEVNYPMDVREDYDFGKKDDNALWGISVRTLQRCMHESYEDCPYYEQLQYAMDTSLQMLFNYQLTDDDLLARKAMDDFAQAQLANGLMPSRTPSVGEQHIPSFQFYFIFMVYAHYVRFGDVSLVRKHLRAMDGVIEWFREHLSDEGLVGQSKYWNFIDWAKPWVYDQKRGCEGGVPLGVNEGYIGIYNPMMAYFLQCAAKLNMICGRGDVANEYLDVANMLKKNTIKYFWDEKRGLFADDVNHIYYSQHMQTWCVLSGVASGRKARRIMKNSLALEAKSTYAFAYFFFRALESCGLYDKTKEMMDSYRGLLKLNCTTVPETPEYSRSDCHAWGAIAIYEFSATVLGVRTENVGEKSVSIKPYIKGRNSAKGTVSTIGGNVRVEWKKSRGVFEISVESENEGVKKHIYLPNGDIKVTKKKAVTYKCRI